MEYIIMADGRGLRWRNSHNSDKKQISINGETLIERTVALLTTYDPASKIVITTHDKSLAVRGATIYPPLHNEYEIDRFTPELLKNDICYLYGDTYYTENAMRIITKTPAESVLFFGTEKRIVAVKIGKEAVFREHFNRVRKMYTEHLISEAIGWEVYHSIINKTLESREIGELYTRIEDATCDFNTYEDYVCFMEQIKTDNKQR